MSVILGLSAALLIGLHLASVGLVAWRLRHGTGRATDPAAPRAGVDRITLLRPVCGLDPFDAQTLGASFHLDWPGYEVIFCAPSEQDRAVPLVRQLIADNPQLKARLLTGQEPLTGNPKLDNLAKGWQAAEADWVCMTDSNLDLPPDYLNRLAESWDSEAGLVSGPPYGNRPDGFGGHLECAFLNGNQARLQLAADSLGRGFAQGKTLFWHRRLLDCEGGLAALGHNLAEDVASTKLVRGLGRQVRLPVRPFAQPIGRRSLAQVWDRQLRWSRVRRDGFPLMFLIEPLNGAVVPMLLLALSGHVLWLPAALVLWYGAELWLARRAGWPAGLADLCAGPCRDLMMQAIWLATFRSRGIHWRGNDMLAPAPQESRA